MIKRLQTILFITIVLLHISVAEANAQCPDIQVIELLDVPGFAQTDELVVCGKADTLAFLIYIEEAGNISGTQMTLDFKSGMQYSGFELTHYDSTTSISVINPDPDNPRFLLDGVTNGVYVGYIGVQSTCDANINGLEYTVDIDFNYIYEDTLGNFYNCKTSVTPIRTYNSVIKTPVLNFQSAPATTISALNTNTCTNVVLSQDGIAAYVQDFEFEMDGLDLTGDIQLNSVKSNGIDVPYTYDAVAQSLLMTVPGSTFTGNANNNPQDTLLNTGERVTLQFCYQVDDCPVGANTFPISYYARFGCAGLECQESRVDQNINIAPTTRPAPIATSVLSQQPGVCGDPAIIDLTLESSVSDSASGMFTDLSVGFETCEKPSLDLARVFVGMGATRTELPAGSYEWINDDISINFAALTSDPDGPSPHLIL